MPSPSLVEIAAYEDPIFAHLARNRLEGEGLQVFLDGEHHVAMDWFISNAVGGVKLLVAGKDKEEAIRILEQRVVTESEPSAIETNVADEHRCPNCSSFDTYREKLRRKLIFMSILLLGVPLPFVSRRIVCDACGNKWITAQA